MSLLLELENVRIILNNNQPPITAKVILPFQTLSDKNRLLYLLKKPEKLEYQKRYHSLNKENYLCYQKGYYEKRKETLLAEKKEKVICECGTVTSAGNLNCHKKTNLHTKRLNKKLCMNIN